MNFLKWVLPELGLTEPRCVQATEGIHVPTASITEKRVYRYHGEVRASSRRRLQTMHWPSDWPVLRLCSKGPMTLHWIVQDLTPISEVPMPLLHAQSHNDRLLRLRFSSQTRTHLAEKFRNQAADRVRRLPSPTRGMGHLLSPEPRPILRQGVKTKLKGL